MTEQRYCKRLIEVDLPIKLISAYARSEKSARRGHISTLHIWWARRPLAACRAVLCASIWPDPADSLCPGAFKEVAGNLLQEFRNKRGGKARDWHNPMELRESLLNFIAEFANWDNAYHRDYLELSQSLTKVAYESLSGISGMRPLVFDPFAGGGAIPLEALRIGCDVYASDLNPIPILLNEVMLQYLPKYGLALADDVEKWGGRIREKAEKELKRFYPNSKDNSFPIAYLWARTIRCEGPGCGAEVPLIRSLWLAKKGNRSFALKLIPNEKQKKIVLEVVENPKSKDIGDGTIKRGAVTCPICGFTTPIGSIRIQLKNKDGGAHDSRLLCVVVAYPNRTGRYYRTPTEDDLHAINSASEELKRIESLHRGELSFIPNEPLPFMSGVFNVPIYGMDSWRKLFTPRQLLCNGVIAKLVSEIFEQIPDKEYALGVCICLSFCLSKIVDRNSSLCTWQNTGEKIGHTFGRQALGMVWDFCESNLFSGATGSWDGAVSLISDVLRQQANLGKHSIGNVEQADARKLNLPDDSAMLLFTDPPYYNAVPYADLSDFFWVWLRRALGRSLTLATKYPTTPKDEELCEMAGWDPVRYKNKDTRFFEEGMTEVFRNSRRIVAPGGLGVVVFAHKTTQGWEALLSSLVKAGWIITASWPLDTEFEGRLRAMGAAALASSVHLVCRPRENTDGTETSNFIGDWRDILNELPGRIRQWLPRLAKEGVVGADAIIACLGPALEIFSRYSYVEKANGEKVELKEYLEQVWGAVAKEALNMIFQGAHTEGFEEDARLTAMWFWTLSTGSNDSDSINVEPADDADEDSIGNVKGTGFSLEYDAARKIAQGLGAHLENFSSIIEIVGDQARLLPVAERVNSLFGKGSMAATPGRKKKKENQMTLFEEFNKVEEQGWSLGDEKSAVGKTVLDRLHQAMILFGAGRGDAMRRFLVDEGIGKDERFWRLAQAFSALYPSHTEEKRWVDGVLARKKSLGF